MTPPLILIESREEKFMAKKKAVQVNLKEYEIQDLKMNRTLKMFVKEEDSRSFEASESFVKKVEISCKIVDASTGQVYKNKISGVENVSP